jgi:hypothetical protein
VVATAALIRLWPALGRRAFRSPDPAVFVLPWPLTRELLQVTRPVWRTAVACCAVRVKAVTRPERLGHPAHRSCGSPAGHRDHRRCLVAVARGDCATQATGTGPAARFPDVRSGHRSRPDGTAAGLPASASGRPGRESPRCPLACVLAACTAPTMLWPGGHRPAVLPTRRTCTPAFPPPDLHQTARGCRPGEDDVKTMWRPLSCCVRLAAVARGAAPRRQRAPGLNARSG